MSGVLLIASGLRAVEAPDDAVFLAGLRERRLYELAEKYCDDRLAVGELTDRNRADLAIELARTLAEHALDASPEDAPALWKRAMQVAADFAAQSPQSPRLLLVQLQGALVRSAEGEAARQSVQDGLDSPANQAARATLRDAISQLQKVAEGVAAQLRRPAPRAAGGDQLTTAELQSLELNVQLELAKALRNQALAYRPSSPDRTNSLARAGEALANLSRHQARTALFWKAAAEQVARMQLQGDYAGAERRLNELDTERPPLAAAQQLRAQRIRLALVRGRIDDALAEAGTAGDRVSVAELDYARLEALLAAWRRAVDSGNGMTAEQWQRRAIDLAGRITADHNQHWGRRAESLLATAVASSGPQTSSTMVLTAAGYYRGGQIDKALAAFDQAARQARNEQQPDRAFEAALSAAAIERERQHFREALDRYRLLALDSPQQAKAPEAHLLAVHCAAQLAQGKTSAELDDYQRLLEEHVKTWPEGPTAAQAYCWLGRLAEHRRRWADAVTWLARVPAGDPRFAEAVPALCRSYEAWLAQSAATGSSDSKLADQALAAMQAIVEGSTRSGGGFSPPAKAAALCAARIWLTQFDSGAVPAERLLRDVLAAESNQPSESRILALRWLVPALAMQGKGGQADQTLDQLPQSGPQMLALLDALTAVRRRQTADTQARLAQTELSVQQRLLAKPAELDGDTLRAVQRRHAVTLAETGRRADGLELLEKLALEYPRDGQTQEDLARLLTDGSEDETRAALDKWIEVVRKSRPGTARFFRASYELARTQLKLGQKAEARTTLQRVAAKYPALGGPEMQPRFAELQRQAGPP